MHQSKQGGHTGRRRRRQQLAMCRTTTESSARSCWTYSERIGSLAAAALLSRKASTRVLVASLACRSRGRIAITSRAGHPISGSPAIVAPRVCSDQLEERTISEPSRRTRVEQGATIHESEVYAAHYLHKGGHMCGGGKVPLSRRICRTSPDDEQKSVEQMR